VNQDEASNGMNFHLSREVSSVLLLLKQVGCIAHIVTIYKVVTVVHADWMDGKPARKEQEVLT
jgi:hypothetical protein